MKTNLALSKRDRFGSNQQKEEKEGDDSKIRLQEILQHYIISHAWDAFFTIMRARGVMIGGSCG
jgi:hypothetical protein